MLYLTIDSQLVGASFFRSRCGYPMVKIFEDMFIRFDTIQQVLNVVVDINDNLAGNHDQLISNQLQCKLLKVIKMRVFNQITYNPIQIKCQMQFICRK